MFPVKLTIAYDGTDFLGWQKSDMGPTVEQTLQSVLNTIAGYPVKIEAASRTDAGVHADGQIALAVMERKIDLGQLHLSLNQMLPSTIAVIRAEAAPLNFHPSLDARSKIYEYSICNGTYQMPRKRLYSWHFPYKLDFDLMENAAKQPLGRNDFAGFTNVSMSPPQSTVRTLKRITIKKRASETLTIEIEGDRFLYKMARNLVGTLLYIGAGKLPSDRIQTLLSSKDRREAGVTAPAHGLSLKQIIY